MPSEIEIYTPIKGEICASIVALKYSRRLALLKLMLPEARARAAAQGDDSKVLQLQRLISELTTTAKNEYQDLYFGKELAENFRAAVNV